MLILLSDGAGLTARQCATALARRALEAGPWHAPRPFGIMMDGCLR
jgi:hypothetical protein